MFTGIQNTKLWTTVAFWRLIYTITESRGPEHTHTFETGFQSEILTVALYTDNTRLLGATGITAFHTRMIAEPFPRLDTAHSDTSILKPFCCFRGAEMLRWPLEIGEGLFYTYS